MRYLSIRNSYTKHCYSDVTNTRIRDKMSAFFKKEELTEAQKEAMAKPVPWPWILFIFGVLVPLMILVFGAEWFFPHNQWVQKYLGTRGKAVITTFIFFLGNLMVLHSKKVVKRTEEEKARREQREREIGTIR